MFSSHRPTPSTKLQRCFLLLVFGLAFFESCIIAAQDFPPTTRKEVGTKWKVSGKVTSSLRPLSGVKIYMNQQSFNYTPMGRNIPRNDQAPVNSTFAGEFEVDVQKNHLLIFSTSGFAPMQVLVPDGSSLDVQLETGRTISGTIKRASGEPIAGAIITPVASLVPNTTDKSRWHGKRISMGFPDFGKARAVKTNTEGKFSIDHMPSKIRVGLSVKAEGWKEEVVLVRPEGDTQPAEYASQILVDNEFNYKTEPCALLEIEATDESSSPAKIARVSIYPNENYSNVFELRRIETFKDTHATLSIPAFPKGSVVYVEPADSERLMGFRFKLPPSGDLEIIEKKIEFPTGKTIRGMVVDETDGKPIEGVKIQWGRLDDPYKQGVKGAFTNLEARTDRNGRFVVAVPDVHGIVSVAGRVKGFSSSACAPQFRDRFPYAREVFEQFGFELKPGEMDDIPPIEFKLKPAFSVELTVVDEKGNPTPNCVVAWNKRNMEFHMSYGATSLSGSPTSHTASTDSNGKVLIPDFYTDAFFLAKARHEAANAKERKRPRGFGEYPIEIQAFSIDGFRQGIARIPLPVPKSDNRTIPVTIKLVIGGSVRGQIVDEDGVGIPKLNISANSGGLFGRGGQLWTTQTREDGKFKMQGLPASGELTWSLDTARVKTTEHNGRIKVDTSELTSESTLELEPIVCMDYSMLQEELPELNVSELSDKDAAKALKAFVKDCYSRIPKKTPRKYTMQGGSGDPVPVYIDKVTSSAQAHILKIIDRNPGSDFELKFIGDMESRLFRSHDSMMGMGGRQFRTFLFDRLIKHHADKKEAQESLVMLIMNGVTQRETQWQKLYDTSPFPKTKRLAIMQIAGPAFDRVIPKCQADQSQQTFETAFEKFDQMLKSVEKHAEDRDPKWDAMSDMYFNHQVKRSQSILKPKKDTASNSGAMKSPELDEARAKKTLDRIEAAVKLLEEAKRKD